LIFIIFGGFHHIRATKTNLVSRLSNISRKARSSSVHGAIAPEVMYDITNAEVCSP